MISWKSETTLWSIPMKTSLSSRNRLLIFTVLPVILLAVLFLYARFNPEDSVFFPKCIFHALTGLECPGCGSQRAIYQLLNGHIAEALHYNALAVIAIPYIAAGIVLHSGIVRGPRTESLKRKLYGSKAAYIALAVIVAFWILRNIFPRI